MAQLADSTEPRLTLVADDGALPSGFAADVAAGLTAAKKQLSCRYLYDADGSALFERICALPEYYLTRTELAILRAHADEIVASCSADAAVVELGSGSATKTRTLLEAALERKQPVRYVPIDISRSMLVDSSRALLANYAGLEITALAVEYRAGLRWLMRQRWPEKLILWLGSNVGNFGRSAAARFVTSIRSTRSTGSPLPAAWPSSAAGSTASGASPSTCSRRFQDRRERRAQALDLVERVVVDERRAHHAATRAQAEAVDEPAGVEVAVLDADGVRIDGAHESYGTGSGGGRSALPYSAARCGPYSLCGQELDDGVDGAAEDLRAAGVVAEDEVARAGGELRAHAREVEHARQNSLYSSHA